MALSFAFDSTKGETPQSIAQKRALIAQIMGSQRAPRNIGEGFSAIGDGIVANVEGGRAREAETAGRESADSTFGALTAMLTGQGGTTPPSSSAGGSDFMSGLINSESGGNWNALNDEGYGGRLQFGDARLADAARAGVIPAGVTGAAFSRMSPDQQQAVEAWHFADIDKQAQSMGLDRYYGQTIAGVPITPESVKAMAHLGGIGGVQKFVTSGGQYNPADSNGTRLSDYGSRFGGGGRQAAPAPVQVASLDPSIGMPSAPAFEFTPQGRPRDPATGFLMDESDPRYAAATAGAPGQPAQLPPLTPPQTAQAAPMAAPAPQQAPAAPVQTAQGPSLQMLMEAAANPWLSDSQKSIINSMIGQQMQQQDPAYQQSLRAGDLGIQKAEFELDALRNKPPPLPGAPKTEKIFDSETGREKMVQWNERTGAWEDLGGVSAPKEPLVQVNTGDAMPGLGKLSNDYSYVTDPATGLPRVDPNTGLPQAAAVPGSPAALAQEQAAAAAAAQSGTQVTTDAEGAATTLATTRSVLDLLDNSDQPTTGTLSRPFAMYSGSPAGKVRSYVNTLQSGVALGAMQRLKEASSTGATGFGALSEKELNILISNIGALDPDNTEPEIFRETVQRIEDQSKRVIADIKRNVSPERIQELGLQPLIDAFGGAPNQSQAPRFNSQADFDAAPSGTVFTAPDGSIRVKP